MGSGHLIRRAPFRTVPRHQPPSHWVWTPTPDGFEQFLRACVGFARDEGLPPRAAGALGSAEGETRG